MNAQLSLSSLEEKMRELGLDFMAGGLESLLSEESRKDRPLMESFHALVDTEYYPRKERMAKTRLKVSGMPVIKRIEDFDLQWLKGGISGKKLKELSSLAFIERKENVILLGPSGTGKTHLMLGLGYKACMEGYTAYHMSCSELIESLKKAKVLGKLSNRIKWLKKPNVLLIDEVGYENLGAEEANLFFQVINARYERGSIILTSNKTFSHWGEILNEDAIASATLDRLLHHAHVLSLQGDSYRMKERLKVGLVDFK
jgi:DNA replication protein DnaC